MFQTVEINKTGRANLIAWLETTLKQSENAEWYAATLVNEHDGSDPGASQIVEVRGFHSATDNPVIYTFGSDELDLINWDEDGNRL